MMGELAHTAGNEPDAVFVRFHFLRNTDQHGDTPVDPQRG